MILCFIWEFAHLHTSVTPVLVVRPTAETVYEGDAYNLTCEIIAYPRAQAGDITWRRNSQPLWVEDPSTGRLAASPAYDPEGRVHLLSVQSHHDTLAFSSLSAPDRAVYVCSVRTSVGNNSIGIFVRVKSEISFYSLVLLWYRWMNLFPHHFYMLLESNLVVSIKLLSKNDLVRNIDLLLYSQWFINIKSGLLKKQNRDIISFCHLFTLRTCLPESSH